ncbi:TetR/AcrR family transcriptional regulator [Pseudomonas boanensis]|uniref:TetR/AcrR family transcriptional regulator n=1 Tax=Metapseudomonas boanensis TaxID=2822138 RepID=UPI0035D50D82
MNHIQNSHDRSNTPDRLRKAALDLFIDNGYQSTSLRDLAAHLGIHAGSLYHHIESKQSLLFEIIEECMSDLVSAINSNLRRARDNKTKLRAFIRTFIEFQINEKKKVLLILRERSNLSFEQRQVVSALRNDYANCLKHIIKFETKETLHNDIELKFLANGIIGMLESIPMWDESDQPLPTQQIVEQLTEIIVRSVLNRS